MGYAIPLQRIGKYAIDEILRARGALTEAPDGGPPLLLRGAEVSIAFATADGLPMQPAEVVVGDTPIPPDEAQRRLEPMSREVLVALPDVSGASAAARGRLILRLIF
jgi:hypothetical protein